MNFQNAVHSVMSDQRKNNNLSDMFAAVRVDNFVIGQFNDKSAF